MKRIISKYVGATVVIAGGTSGMGESVARLLAPYAKTIVLFGRDKKAGALIVKSSPANLRFQVVEMKDNEAVERAIQHVTQQYGQIDYFYNFAGTFLAGEIRDTPVSDWHAIYENNILPITHGTAAVYGHMRKNNRGTIVNVASAAGLFPVPVMNIYGSTKSAVVSLTLGLRLEAQASNIQVNVVCPTIVDTPLYDTARYDGTTKSKVLSILKRSNVQHPDQAAIRIVRGVAKNKAIIQTSWYTRFASFAYRCSPDTYLLFAGVFLKRYRKSLRSV